MHATVLCHKIGIGKPNGHAGRIGMDRLTYSSVDDSSTPAGNHQDDRAIDWEHQHRRFRGIHVSNGGIFLSLLLKERHEGRVSNFHPTPSRKNLFQSIWRRYSQIEGNVGKSGKFQDILSKVFVKDVESFFVDVDIFNYNYLFILHFMFVKSPLYLHLISMYYLKFNRPINWWLIWQK